MSSKMTDATSVYATPSPPGCSLRSSLAGPSALADVVPLRFTDRLKRH